MMESEIVDEIPECSVASLHAYGTETVLNKKDELLNGNFYAKETPIHPQGQVVPAHSPSCLKPRNEVNQYNEHSTVPQDTLEVKDLRKESGQLSKTHQNEFLEGKGLEKLTSTLSMKYESIKQENAMKTFLWPPIGFKDKITEPLAPINEPGALEQAVLQRKDERNITIPQELPPINNVNQSEEHSSQEEENNKLTSILKKSDIGSKKTVHFPKNIVSVKFYDISDEESDNDTEILSDPEDEDLKDQEVPLNTYDDYDPDCCHPTSMNFIPQFKFPPILKIANSHLYESIDDHDEQIMAIMEDDDGCERLYPNDLAAGKIYYQENTSGLRGDVPTSQEVTTQNENPKEALSEIMVTQEPITKNGIEHNDDNLEINGYRNTAGPFEFENLEVDQQTPAKDKTISETVKDVHLPIAEIGIDQQNVNGDQNGHRTPVKIKTIVEKPEEVETNTPVAKTGIERLVNENNTNEYKCDDTSKEMTLFKNLAEDKEVIEVHGLTMQNKVKPLEDDVQVNEFVESERSVVKQNPLATFNQLIGNPAMIHANSSSVNNDTNVKVAKVNKLDVKVYSLLDALKAAPNNSVKLTEKERFTGENVVQQATSPERVLEGKNASMISLPESEIPQFHAQQLHKMQTELPKPDMAKKWLLATRDVVSHDDTSAMADATFGTTENVDMLATDMTRNPVKKQQAANALQNDVFAVSNESSDGCTATLSSARAFHGNCGSNFLWRGSRSINNMILDEDFQVPIGPVAKNEISHPLAKEEITFSKAAIINVKSLESNIVAAAVWKDSIATEPCCLEEVKLEKYDHSFLSSPDHLNEFEELEQSASETDFPNMKQRKHSNFGNGKSFEQNETGLHEHQIVPDIFVQDQLKTQPMKDSPRAVPSGVDDIVTMDTTNSSLHLDLDSYPQQNLSTLKNHKIVKDDSLITPVPCNLGLSNSHTSMLATQGRQKLRVGLSKRTRVKSLHPYWSKEKIKQSRSIP